MLATSRVVKTHIFSSCDNYGICPFKAKNKYGTIICTHNFEK